MAHINLLPWREELRKERQQQFGIATAIAIAFTGLVFFGVYTYVNDLIDYQTQRNDLLKQAIKEANKKIEEIEVLKKAEDNLRQRIAAIESLEESRSDIVHMFDELAKSRPDNVYYESLTQSKEKVSVEGYAQSNALVSTLVRNLSRSPWIKSVRIGQTNKRKKNSLDLYEFTLTYEQQTALEAVKSLTSEVKFALDNAIELGIERQSAIERLADLPEPYKEMKDILLAMVRQKDIPAMSSSLSKKLDSVKEQEIIDTVKNAQQKFGLLDTGNSNEGQSG